MLLTGLPLMSLSKKCLINRVIIRCEVWGWGGIFKKTIIRRVDKYLIIRVLFLDKLYNNRLFTCPLFVCVLPISVFRDFFILRMIGKNYQLYSIQIFTPNLTPSICKLAYHIWQCMDNWEIRIIKMYVNITSYTVYKYSHPI